MRMRLVFLAAILAAACDSGNDEPILDAAPDAPATACTTSTLPETAAEWTACRDADVDSVPVFCGEGATVPACAFTATTSSGETAICRPAGCM